jgi:selenocysteine-specific elongation factor
LTPRRNIIIGTAGHIDHGKTVLVKALTGRDTDRLAEEKERGISIDLGFAPLVLSDGSVAGIVDVPGHENFVRNMLAGATGVDLALLVVAADDGVMPQTKEHLAILDLLGVSRGVVAITKIDLVDEEMLELVTDEVDELLEGTALEGSPVVPVSCVTGQGVAELRSEIERQAAEVRLKDEALPPRLPIDRVFTLKGIGTVVTGTVWSGTVSDGDQLELLPAERSVRVRALQVHDSDRETVYAGERAAMNLAGISRGEISRGDLLTAPGVMRPTYMVDVRVKLLRDWGKVLKRGARLRLHHGTREVLGRIYPLEADRIEPGDRVPAQLRLESSIVCTPGDRFVLRSYSPVTTIGGGTVVDAHPRKHKVHDPAALSDFAELETADPGRTVAVHLARAARPVSEMELMISSGLPPVAVSEGLEAMLSSGLAVALGENRSAAYVHKSHCDDAIDRLRSDLEEFHAGKPLAEGMVKETLKKKALKSWDARSADTLIERMAENGDLEIDGKFVRLAGSQASVTSDQQALMTDIIRRIGANPVAPPTLSELADELGQDRRMLSELLGIAEKERKVVRVSPELYFSPEAIALAKTKLRSSMGPDGIAVGDFKNHVGTTRKYALPLLEYFDRTRVTVRVGDVRKLR